MPRRAIKRKNVVVKKEVRSVVTNVNDNHREQNSREDVKNTKKSKAKEKGTLAI